MLDFVDKLLNPGTFFGSLLISIISSGIIGFFWGRNYERYAKVNQKGQQNIAVVNSEVNNRGKKDG